MANYYKAKSLEILERQLNCLFPKRLKVSDGWIGDPGHRASKSDHNPNKATGAVTAFDFTHSPETGLDCESLATALYDSKDARIKYLIWNGKITVPGMRSGWKPYPGKNKHSQHLHISVSSNPALYDNAKGWDLTGITAYDKPKPKPEPKEYKLLRVGSKGKLVVNLQTALAKLHYYAGAIDGDYGEQTRRAVLGFQRGYGLKWKDGIAGTETQTKLFSM